MADFLSPKERSRRMSLIRGRDTRPEVALRSGLHRLGFRFRTHDKRLPGTPDIRLPSFGAVIFVNGCYWHAHACQKGRIPGSGKEFWSAKFRNNRSRDARNIKLLRALGWKVLLFWECSLSSKVRKQGTLERIKKALRYNLISSNGTSQMAEPKAYTTSEKREAIKAFVTMVRDRSLKKLIPFDKAKLPGSKRDFIKVLRAASPPFSKASEASVEEYLRELGCKFTHGRALAPDKTIRTLFPEFFKAQ